MVLLWCAIVGEGRVFNVDIDGTASVEHLKDAIKGKIPIRTKYIDANKLQLYLAERGDAWLTFNQVMNLSSIDGVIHIRDSSSTIEASGCPSLLSALWMNKKQQLGTVLSMCWYYSQTSLRIGSCNGIR